MNYKNLLLTLVLFVALGITSEVSALTFDKTGLSGLRSLKLGDSLTLGTWNSLQNLSDGSGGKIIPGISYEGVGLTTNAWYDKSSGVWRSLGSGHAGAFIMESGSAWFAYAYPPATDVNQQINWAISSKWYSYPTGNMGIGKKFDATDFGKTNILDGEPEEELHIATDSGNSARILIQTDSSDGAPGIWLRRSRGSMKSPSNLVPGDVIGQIRAFAWSGSGSTNNYHQGAAINWEVDDQNFSSGQRPSSRLTFYTNERGNSDYARMVIKADGKVGIGTMNPTSKLQIAGGHCSDEVGDGGCTADFAEYYPSSIPVETGELVAVDPQSKTYGVTRMRKGLVPLGIVSSAPAAVAANGSLSLMNNNYQHNSLMPAIALSGRVPAKVSDENGKIEKGDRLMPSKTREGYLMKFSGRGIVVAIALEALEKGEGKILSFINMGYVEEDAPQTGMEFKDKSTGEVYCVGINNGQWEKIAGSCQ